MALWILREFGLQLAVHTRSEVEIAFVLAEFVDVDTRLKRRAKNADGLKFRL